MAAFFWVMITVSVTSEEAVRPDSTAFRRAVSEFVGRFVTAEGRVVDDYNGGISHSEGQGYGMLAAALSGNREAFDRIWSWTRDTLFVREDGLAAWRWDPHAEPHVTDRNNATDGDLLIAWALIEGGERWHGSYAAEGRRIADAVAQRMVFAVGPKRFLRPAAVGFGAEDRADGPVVNLSYWVFPALVRLAAADPAGPWTKLIDGGLDLLEASRFGPARLPSDWISVAGSPSPSEREPARFGYDAVRIPLYLAWAFPREDARLQGFSTVLAEGHPQVIDLLTGAPLEPFGGTGFSVLGEVIARAEHRAPTPGPDLAKDSYYATIIGVFSLYVLAYR
ncbi:glycosyl hydrolase family 8 [Methylobacterium sp. J-090]|uniref:glycosyl hydrolase family 8 n=1 Tax=Methylobacterium sp. J-090 TaxID=2836666 RepID=UPI001FBA0C9C|nr:glycosyl hydrolase family 8 [Methylobacterium sp. J-090]MCJ2082089.1 glycosyl hydrolase family 8 [Methylobacterium sp. J-090]